MKVYIRTFGCQMNEHDSERMGGLLYSLGHSITHQEEEADFILINTCSIRQKAEQKVFSFLGRIRFLKDKNPKLKIGVCGCIAQREGALIIKKAPYVDLVFGTKNIHRLPVLLDKIINSQGKVVEVTSSDEERPKQFHYPLKRQRKVSAWVTIMQGCNNYCSYCVVPYVRGNEWSRPPEDILTEIRQLADWGYKEINLLGHNVNSYAPEGIKEYTFPALLRSIQEIQGIERIRFMTSHPKDFSIALIEAIADCPKVCEHIHLPFQSGSDKILKEMKRNYSCQEYIEKVMLLRKKIPQATISSDVIVGFPGEEEEDFQQTLQLIEIVQFEGLFTFLYSSRPQTSARNFPQQVPTNIKQERFEILLDMQNTITSQRNQILVGIRQEVLIEEGAEKKDGLSLNLNLFGRTRSNKIVECEGSSDLIGTIREIEIQKATRFRLEGKLIG